jgi:riboflavin synthase
MFTGIIAEMGTVESIARQGGSVVLTIKASKLAAELALGDSVAVNGVCQTVTSVGAGKFGFEAVEETLAKTTLSMMSRGSEVNLEPALCLGDRIGGHLVSGHVDSTAIVRKRRVVSAGNIDFAVQVPGHLARYIYDKGSICFDGVSLTVKAVNGSMVEVTVVPWTLETTIIRHWRVGTSVNAEVDQLAKYLTPKGYKGGGLE